jgi:hypothetical protein
MMCCPGQKPQAGKQQQQQQQQPYLGSKTCPSQTTLHAASCLNDDSISKSFFSSTYSSSKHSTAQPLLLDGILLPITNTTMLNKLGSIAGKPPRQLFSSLFWCSADSPPTQATCSVSV